MIVLDTNIVILFVQGDEEIVRWVNRQRKNSELFGISTMSVVELLGFPRISPEEIMRIEQWLKALYVVDVDTSIAREAAQLRREFRLSAIDAVIAATAVIMRATLATRDVQLKRIRDIEVVKP